MLFRRDLKSNQEATYRCGYLLLLLNSCHLLQDENVLLSWKERCIFVDVWMNFLSNELLNNKPPKAHWYRQCLKWYIHIQKSCQTCDSVVFLTDPRCNMKCSQFIHWHSAHRPSMTWVPWSNLQHLAMTVRCNSTGKYFWQSSHRQADSRGPVTSGRGCVSGSGPYIEGGGGWEGDLGAPIPRLLWLRLDCPYLEGGGGWAAMVVELPPLPLRLRLRSDCWRGGGIEQTCSESNVKKK